MGLSESPPAPLRAQGAYRVLAPPNTSSARVRIDRIQAML
jgi:hypothetical protein